MISRGPATARATFARHARACVALRPRKSNDRGFAALLVGGASCAAAAAACDRRYSCCESTKPCSAVHAAVHTSLATSTVTAQPAVATEKPAAAEGVKDGQDFAVFQRPQGPLIVFDAQGEAGVLASTHASLQDLLEAISSGVTRKPSQESPRTNVILLGEVHDDSVAHELQLLILRHCLEVCKVSGRRLVLSLEMFENDVQQVLDEYVVQRAIRERDFLQDSRPWGNYAKDYRPLVELCRDNGVRVVAANAPRRYVSLAARGGSKALQGLLEQASNTSQVSSLLPPLPLPPASPAYHMKFVETIASQMPPAPAASSESTGECPYIGFKGSDVREARSEMITAQLLWDHTMAQSIANSLKQPEGATDSSTADVPLVVHVCGAFHCAHGLGIPEVLPLYSHQGAAEATQAPPAPLEQPWLPLDDVCPPSQNSVPNSESDAPAGPKQNPPGVLSVICWPASVKATLEAVQGGQQLPSLGIMGDYVVVTEETFD